MAPRTESRTRPEPLGAAFRGVRFRGGYTVDLFLQALKDSLAKFDPRVQIRNPVMFVVWVGTLVTLALTIQPDLFGPSNASRLYNGIVTVVLALTVWFANYAEALAEGRGKAKATALRQTRADLIGVRVLEDGRTEKVPAADLRKGDLIRVEKNDVVPADGDVVEGLAYVNEAAITGESAPVLKEPGTDMFSSVTAGTTVISDWLIVRVSADPGGSFLDRIIHLVEGAKRQKTPNEIALTVLLSILTLIFVIVVAAIAPVATYLQAQINVADLIALLVALIPTTIAALLSAIGIAGMDRTLRFNVLAMSGKAVETAGDVQTLLLEQDRNHYHRRSRGDRFHSDIRPPAERAGSGRLSCIPLRYDAGRPIRCCKQRFARREAYGRPRRGQRSGILRADPDERHRLARWPGHPQRRGQRRRPTRQRTVPRLCAAGS